MFVGDDWKDTKEWIQIEKDFSEYNVEIIYFSYTTLHTSSTILRDILKKVRKNNE